MRNIVASTQGTTSDACTDGTRVLNVGFYAYFEPLSYSADPDPNADGFNTHQGYEADLLTALEAMEGTGLSFSRTGISKWPGIWLKAAEPAYDMVGGGITIWILGREMLQALAVSSLRRDISHFGSLSWSAPKTQNASRRMQR